MSDGQCERAGSHLRMTVRRPLGELRGGTRLELAADRERFIDHLPEQGPVLVCNQPIAASSANRKAVPGEAQSHLIDRGDAQCDSKPLVTRLVLLERL